MEYGPIPSSKYEEVLNHLRHNFPDEPLNKSVGLCKHGQPCELLENLDLMALREGLSIMAVDKLTGDIAGVALNGIALPGEVDKELENLKSIDNIKFRQIFGLLYSVNQKLDLFMKYNVDKIFELRILSVDSKYRGRGLAKELFLRSEIIAEEYGFKIFKVDATSQFTQKIAETLGLKTAKAVRYSDFKDENGKAIYNTISPHDFYKVMFKELSPQSIKG